MADNENWRWRVLQERPAASIIKLKGLPSLTLFSSPSSVASRFLIEYPHCISSSPDCRCPPRLRRQERMPMHTIVQKVVMMTITPLCITAHASFSTSGAQQRTRPTAVRNRRASPQVARRRRGDDDDDETSSSPQCRAEVWSQVWMSLGLSFFSISTLCVGLTPPQKNTAFGPNHHFLCEAIS